MSELNERIRQRLRAEMSRRRLSQEDIAGLLRWTQSRVSQKLTGRTPITVDELDALAFALGLSLVELVRDPGLEFVAELTPTELRFIDRLRQFSQEDRDAFLRTMRVMQNTPIHERRALPAKPPRKTPLRIS